MSDPFYPTFGWFRWKLGVEVFEGPWLGSYDVVLNGAGKNNVERFRTPGVAFRYFQDHRARIADFSSRLEKFKRRAALCQ